MKYAVYQRLCGTGVPLFHPRVYTGVEKKEKERMCYG